MLRYEKALHETHRFTQCRGHVACILWQAPAFAQPEPFADPVKAAIDAFERIGAAHAFAERPGFQGTQHIFRLPPHFTDDHVRELPAVAIPVTLSLHDTQSTDTGVNALGKTKNIEGL